jgi:hypothetical protein
MIDGQTPIRRIKSTIATVQKGYVTGIRRNNGSRVSIAARQKRNCCKQIVDVIHLDQ